MKDFDRYGVVETGRDHIITNFKEKKIYTTGNINGGLYLLNVPAFLKRGFPERFSFEKDYLEKFFPDGRFGGIIDDDYFIDIGMPEDFQRAQLEFSKAPFHPSGIDESWTLFLDRDGVINHEKKEDYILNWEEFRFYDGVKEALAKLSGRFGKIIVISNQRGVGRDLMTMEELERIHQNMKKEIADAGGRIDAIYFCAAADNKDSCRKPNPGMAFQAKKEYPGIDLSKAVMIGNKLSDMRFARNAGVYSLFVTTTNPDTAFPHPDIDQRYDDLAAFANSLG
jgi:D-glycero-alpha-D-manno-heptose 1-phosphate guanylyltransferase